MDVSRSTTRDDSLFYSSSRCSQGVLHTKFCLLHLGLCRCADADHCNTACQFGKSFLQLLSIKVRCCLLDLSADLGYTSIDLCLISLAVYDNGIFFLNFYGFCTSELIHGGIFEIKTELLCDHFTTGQDGNIFEHLFSSIAIARGFHCYNLECAAKFIQYQSAECFALNILSNDQKFGAGLYHLLQQWKNLLNIGNLLICNENIWILKICFHFIHICSHVSGEITAVKLHTFYQIKLCLHGLGFFDGNNSIIGNLLHRICHHLSNLIIPGRNSCYFGDLLFALQSLTHLFDRVHCTVCRFFHSLAENDRIRTCCQVLHSLIDHRLSKNSSCRCTVSSNIIGLGSYFLNQLSSHILKCIF